MSCCRACDSGMGCTSGLGHLMGAIQQQLPPANAGAPFTFDFNEPLVRAVFNSPEDIAGWLEAAGVSYNTTSYKLAGILHPYVRVQGNANAYWDSGSDLGFEIYNTIIANGYDVDPASINFSVEPYYPAKYKAPPAPVGSPAPTATISPNTSTASSSSQCDLQTMGFGNWAACELGISPIAGAAFGGVGALVGVGMLALIVLVAFKR